MRPIADTANFIIVYPQALPDPNDDGSANWLHKAPTDVDDIFFVEAMINTIASEYSISKDRIYALGYSLGGEFTYELACRLNDQIAAVGVVARTMNTTTFDNCSPSHPTGIMTILGTDDFISPYDGLVWNGIQFYVSADDVHNYWSNYNNTTSGLTITLLPNINPFDGSTVERHLWTDGDGCVAVEHLKVIGGGHDWPGSFGNMDIDASLEIWNFVSKYDLTGLMACNTTAVAEHVAMPEESRIYPNPASLQINLDTNFDFEQEYQLYAPNGKLIQKGKVSSDDKTIDLSGLLPGIYFLKINDDLLKFIKTE